MGFVAFIVSMVVCGAVLSLVEPGNGFEDVHSLDYHYVPYAGDAFGA